MKGLGVRKLLISIMFLWIVKGVCAVWLITAVRPL